MTDRDRVREIRIIVADMLSTATVYAESMEKQKDAVKSSPTKHMEEYHKNQAFFDSMIAGYLSKYGHRIADLCDL